MGFVYSLIGVATGITMVLAGLLVYAIRYGDNDDDLFAPSHQQRYDEDGTPFQR